MSIATNLERIISSKDDIKNAIISKGVTVLDSDKIDVYADKIYQIQQGTSIEMQSISITENGKYENTSIPYSSVTVNVDDGSARIKELEDEIVDLNSQITQKQNKIDELQSKLDYDESLINDLRNEITSLENQKALLESELNELKSKVNSMTDLTVSENGTYTPTFGYKSVTVNVPQTGSDITLTEITITDVGEYTAPEKIAYNKVLVPSETFYKKYTDEKGNTFIINEDGEKIITVSGSTPTPTDDYVYFTIYIPSDNEYSGISSNPLLKTEVSEAYFDDAEYGTTKTQDGECFYLDHRSITKDSYHTVKLKLVNPDSLTSTYSSFSIHFKGSTSTGIVKVTKVILPEGLTELKHYFVDGYNLIECIFPTTIKFIGEQALQNQMVLEINLPNTVKTIGTSAFQQCSGLTSVTIPNSVTSIGYSVFSSCTSLININYNGSYNDLVNMTSGKYWKTRVPTSCIVHCTDGDYPITDFPT